MLDSKQEITAPSDIPLRDSQHNLAYNSTVRHDNQTADAHPPRKRATDLPQPKLNAEQIARVTKGGPITNVSASDIAPAGLLDLGEMGLHGKATLFDVLVRAVTFVCFLLCVILVCQVSEQMRCGFLDVNDRCGTSLLLCVANDCKA